MGLACLLFQCNLQREEGGGGRGEGEDGRNREKEEKVGAGGGGSVGDTLESDALGQWPSMGSD